MIQRTVKFKLFALATALAAYLFTSVQNEARRTDALQLDPVDMGKVPDGVHDGGFVYQNQWIKVSVTTESQTIQDIRILENIKGDLYAESAKALVAHVLSSQKLAFPSNTTDSLQIRAAKKAILHAIHGALTQAPVPAEKERSPRTPAGILFLVSFYACCASLGTQLAGYTAFRSGNVCAATVWVRLEDITIIGAGACCGFGLLLTIMG